MMAKTQRAHPSKLEDHIGFWMRLISNSVSHGFAQKLEASGVTVAEWVILREMYDNHNETSPSTVAELTGLTRGAVSKLITRLLEKEFVTRKEFVGDRRYQEIKLTSSAIKLVPKLAQVADENDEEYFSGLSKAERHELLVILKKLAKQHQIKTRPIE